MNKQILKRKNYEHIEILFEISYICNNNCTGCYYPQNVKKDSSYFSFEKFKKSFDSLMYFADKNQSPVVATVGVGDLFMLGKETVFKYLDIILKNEHINKKYKYSAYSKFEITLTLKNKDDHKIVKEIYQYIKNSNSKNVVLALDIVLDPFFTKDIEIINKNFDIISKIKDIEWNVFIKYNKFFDKKEIFNIIKKYHHKSFLIDFLTKDIKYNNKMGDYEKFIDWFSYTIEEGKKYGIFFLNNDFENIKSMVGTNQELVNMEENNIIDMQGNFYINKDNILCYSINTLIGTIFINEFVEVEDKLEIKLDDYYKKEEKLYNKIKMYILKIKRKNLLHLQNNEICAKCEHNKYCPSYFINELSKYRNIPITKESCLYGKQIYNDIFDEK